MNRLIKFRAWDGKQFWWNQFTITSSGLINKSEPVREWHSWKNEDWVLNQFTGLKDKNNKDIYEDDIITIGDTETDSISPEIGGPSYNIRAIGIVEFIDSSFGCKIISGGDYLRENEFMSFIEICQEVGLQDIQIIGNIYENPELL